MIGREKNYAVWNAQVRIEATNEMKEREEEKRLALAASRCRGAEWKNGGAHGSSAMLMRQMFLHLIWFTLYPTRWHLHKSKEAQPCGRSIILALSPVLTVRLTDFSCCWWWIQERLELARWRRTTIASYLGMGDIKLHASWISWCVGSFKILNISSSHNTRQAKCL